MKWTQLQFFVLMAVLVSMSISAQTLVQGKIFTSAEQRQYLDYLRNDFLAKNKQKGGFNFDDSQIPDIPTNAPNSPTTPETYSLDGIISRADGRLTILLNHQPTTEKQLPANFHLVRDGSTLALKVVTKDGHSQLLRPGQTIDLTSGAVNERLHITAAVAKQATSNTSAAAPATETKAEKSVADGNGTEVATKAAEKADSSIAETNTDTVGSDTPKQQSLIDSLPAEVRDDPKVLNSIIQSLMNKRTSSDENKSQ